MRQIFKNQIFQIVIAIIILAALTGGGFYFGYQKGTENPKTLIVQGVSNIDQGKEKNIDFNLFWETWGLLKEKYVKGDELKNQDMVYGAIGGLFKALDDPNSTFMPPEDAKKFDEDISGEFSGIGAEIGIRNEQLVIIAPLKDTPAEKAGLRSADKIFKIDDKFTDNMTVVEAVKLIRGKKDTKVVLSIFRDDWEKPKEISIIRDTIQVPTLDWKMLDNNIAYIQLYNFYEKAPFLFYQAAVSIVVKNPSGVILDLRDNPGGYLDAAINISSWFLERGKVVVTEEFKGGEKQIFNSRANDFFKGIPVVILINQGSASASEITAGALKDQRGAKLVGEKSFGKGTVQELMNLKDGAVAKITVAHWRMPSGQLIEKNGITPDYEVKLTDEDIEAKKDPQLDKAMEILKNEISNF